MIDVETSERLNGRAVPDVLTAALELHARGLDVVRLHRRDKRPVGDDWQSLRYADEAAVIEAFGDGDNVGVLLGGGHADVDLDCAEARRIAPHMLLPTEMIHGRPSARASHRAYSYAETTALPSRRYRDPRTRETLLELRADRTDGGRGLQTMVPPSIHPCGEVLAWELDGDPAAVDPAALRRDCDDLAAAVLLRRVWPGVQGSRHDAAMALGGMLARGGIDEARALRIVEGALRHGVGDEEWCDRLRAVSDSYAAVARGQRATGAPTLADVIGGDVVQALRDWLGLGVETEATDADESRPRFRLLTDAEIESREPPEMLIAGVVPAGALGILWGAPGSLKTFVGLDVALHIQTGREWCGRAVRRGNVLYVIAEGAGQFGRRVAAWKAWHGIEGDTGARWLPEAVQLREAADVRALVRAVEDAGAAPLSLVVVDTFARCAVAVDENSATDTGLLIAGCDAIRRATGAAVLLIHHAGKDGLRERGSSALRGAADTMITATVDGDVVTLKCDKTKDVEPFGEIYLRRRIVQLSETDLEATSLVLEPIDRDAATARPMSRTALKGSARTAYDALVTCGRSGATATEWQAVANLPNSTFFKARTLLVDEWQYVYKAGQRYVISD